MFELSNDAEVSTDRRTNDGWSIRTLTLCLPYMVWVNIKTVYLLKAIRLDWAGPLIEQVRLGKSINKS